MIHEQRHIVGAFTERWNFEMNHGNSIVQVLAEPRGCQGGGGRRNEANIHLGIPRGTEPAHRTLLNRSQQLRLKGGRKIPYFIEEQGSFVGLFEEPRVVADRAREGPAPVAEKLTFEKPFRDGGAVHGHPGALPTRGKPVQRPSEQLLPGAALSSKQNRRIMICRPGQHPKQLRDLRRPSYESLDRFARTRREPGIFHREATTLRGKLFPLLQLSQRQDDFISFERLGNVVVGAAPHRLQRGIDTAVRAHHHDRRRPGRARIQKRESIHIRHSDITKNDVSGGLTDERLGTRSRSDHEVAGAGEDQLQQMPEVLFVIHHEHTDALVGHMRRIAYASAGFTMRRLVQVVHGFPPRENAGTERVAAQIAEGVRARGWFVHTLAATREPGAAMYGEREERGVSRLVNNAPYAAVRRAGADLAARTWMERKLRELRPDVVHVHHLGYLDNAFVSEAPVVWTLHDAWGWCAAGGQLFREGAACAGPGPACSACASAWVQDGPGVAAALHVAGSLARFTHPERLHRLWQRLPGRLRAAATRGGSPVSEAQIASRSQAFRTFAQRCAAIVAPSRWLAGEAEAQGFGRVEVVPNGVPPGLPRRGGGGFLFLGTIAEHKGPDLVLEAHRMSGVSRPLRIIGPAGPDAAFVARVPHEPPVTDPRGLLSEAHTLVVGSRWPENAPLVVLEARAAGCPVIAPAIGGLPELVQPGVDGWLYTPGNASALARCIAAADIAAPLPVRPAPTLDEAVDATLGVYDRIR